MRWKLNRPRKPIDRWHPWFAWYPVRIGNELVWWETVERRKSRLVPGQLLLRYQFPVWQLRNRVKPNPPLRDVMRGTLLDEWFTHTNPPPDSDPPIDWSTADPRIIYLTTRSPKAKPSAQTKTRKQ